MIARGGQCEDYALVKYLALRSLGISPNAMRIVAVRSGFVDHAVLVVKLGNRLYMLDNLRREMVDSANAPSYRLIYALNEHGFWRYLNDEIPIPGAPMPATMTPAYVPTPGVIPLTTAELTQLPAAQPVEQIVSLPQPLSLGQQSAATPY